MKSLGLILILSCFIGSVNASQTLSQNTPLADIYEISIDAIRDKFNDGDVRGIKLHLVQQDKEELRITAPKNLMPKIKIQNVNGKLSIDIVPLSAKDVATGIIDIFISTNATNKIHLIGQIDTTVSDYEAAKLIDIIVQKGGKLTASSLKAPMVILKSVYGSEIKLAKVNSNQLTCAADFGAMISIHEVGRVNNLEASASFGGNVSAPLLNANKGKLDASFGSSIRFNQVKDVHKSSSFNGDIQLAI
ncbi:MAG: DUF2807 domain-containing protein [Pseudomonadota bacterium]